MSRSKDDSGQAFPCLELGMHGLDLTDGGMTLRQYAAINLRVPDSGTDWLDEMIRTSQRNELAAKAMQGIAANSSTSGDVTVAEIVYACHQMADSMLKASSK